MPGISQAANWVALGFVAALGATVLVQIFNGQINTRHLLWGRRSSGQMYFSPERVQLLLFTLWAAASYLMGASHSISTGKLPDVPSQTLALLGGSHGVYLGGKAWAMLVKK
jgi:hypothetical protein